MEFPLWRENIAEFKYSHLHLKPYECLYSEDPFSSFCNPLVETDLF